MQAADRATGEASELQMDELSPVWDSDALGMNRDKFLRLHEGACLNSTLAYQDDLP